MEDFEVWVPTILGGGEAHSLGVWRREFGSLPQANIGNVSIEPTRQRLLYLFGWTTKWPRSGALIMI